MLGKSCGEIAMAHEQKKPAEKKSASGETGSPIRPLLIVDDNEVTCKQLQHLLQSDAGLRVEFLTDSNKAMAALEQGKYGLVLTDLRMPKLDGMDMIRQIKE